MKPTCEFITDSRKESIMKQSAKIYSFDFDGTIVQNKYPEIGEPISEVIQFIQRVKADGNYIILNTMREGKHLNQAVDFCRDNGIVFDAVNDNLPHMQAYFKNNPRKIFANYYIDDRNLFMPEINSLTSEDYAGKGLIPVEVLQQVMWERDAAIEQIEELGGRFGGITKQRDI